MSQLKRLMCLGLVSIFGLMVTVPLRADTPPQDKANWDNLKQLPPGQEIIQVVLNDAKSYRGIFQKVSDHAMVVRLATGDQIFPRENILRVSSKGRSHRGRNAGIGAAIGVGVGAALGSAFARYASNEGSNPAAYLAGAVAVFTGMGAGVGAALPTGGWRDVYRAR
jgi:hypothetical protein